LDFDDPEKAELSTPTEPEESDDLEAKRKALTASKASD
jgi:hypothetical protein